MIEEGFVYKMLHKEEEKSQIFIDFFIKFLEIPNQLF